MQTAIDKDMAVIHENGNAEYVENQSNSVEAEVVSEQEMKEVEMVENGNREEPQKDVQSDFFN